MERMTVDNAIRGVSFRRIRNKRNFVIRWDPLDLRLSCQRCDNPHLHATKIYVYERARNPTTRYLEHVTFIDDVYRCGDIASAIERFDRLRNDSAFFDATLDPFLMESLL